MTPSEPSPVASFRGIPFRLIPNTLGHSLAIAPARGCAAPLRFFVHAEIALSGSRKIDQLVCGGVFAYIYIYIYIYLFMTK